MDENQYQQNPIVADIIDHATQYDLVPSDLQKILERSGIESSLHQDILNNYRKQPKPRVTLDNL